MQIETKMLSGAMVVAPALFRDDRGWFYESYSQQKLLALGIDTVFVQDNCAYSKKANTLRGLHCQTPPAAQAKLVTCTQGAILDVLVDVRRGSPTYLQWASVLLSDENRHMVFVPRGFLHGYVTLCDNVQVAYKVDAYYQTASDRCVRYNDPALGIDWGVAQPILSDKDKTAPLLQDSDIQFIY